MSDDTIYCLKDSLVTEHWSEGPMQPLLQSPPVHPGERTQNTDFSAQSPNTIKGKEGVSSSNTYSGESSNLVGSSGWEVGAENYRQQHMQSH